MTTPEQVENQLAKWKKSKHMTYGLNIAATYKKFSLDPKFPCTLTGPGIPPDVSWGDLTNYPPYTKEKLDRIMYHEPYFLDSDEELTIPKLNPNSDINY